MKAPDFLNCVFPKFQNAASKNVFRVTSKHSPNSVIYVKTLGGDSPAN